jgi:single-strand DNA-binding protein
MAINHLTIQGNLTRDPELRVTPKGTAICSFGIAHNRKWKDESGTEREDVCFLDVEAWGKTGETIAKFFTKGGQIIVEGPIKFDQWEDKTTQAKRSKHKLSAEKFHFCGQSKGGEGQGQQGGEQQQRSPERHTPPPRAAAKPQPPENLDEDVPF